MKQAVEEVVVICFLFSTFDVLETIGGLIQSVQTAL